MISITTVQHQMDILTVEQLASIIWKEHYTAIIGAEQVAYMLREFQSVDAIQQQLKQGFHYYLVYSNQDAVGYCSIQQRDSVMFLSKLYVLESYRGLGIGKRVLEFIVNKAKESRCSSISLTVNKYNYQSIKAYQQLGFTIVDEIVADIGGSYVMDDYVMEKEVLSL